jgi:phosphoglycolate phosphatase
MDRPAALLFDLDGTLVDSAVTIALALSELSVARGGEPVDVARVRRLVSKGAPVLVRETLGSLASGSKEDVAAFREILVGIPATTEMIFPDVVPALEEVTAAGHPCAVVTNKPERLARLLLDQLDLGRFFGAVVGGDSLPVCKPDPEPLRHAVRALASTPGGAAMIGDSQVDARAARAAGMPFLLYRCGYEADDCEAASVAAGFDGFSELAELVVTLDWRPASTGIGEALPRAG